MFTNSVTKKMNNLISKVKTRFDFATHRMKNHIHKRELENEFDAGASIRASS